jgi:hypothetical protein
VQLLRLLRRRRRRLPEAKLNRTARGRLREKL